MSASCFRSRAKCADKYMLIRSVAHKFSGHGGEFENS
jgi:hypothetical protein